MKGEICPSHSSGAATVKFEQESVFIILGTPQGQMMEGGGGGGYPGHKPLGSPSLSYLSLLLTAITGLHPQL